MNLIERYRNQRLFVKILIPLFFLIAGTAVGILIGREIAFNQATFRAGERRANQEIQLINNQFDTIEHDLLLSAKLLVSTPGLPEAVQEQNQSNILALTLIGTNNLDLDMVDVINVDGEIIASQSAAANHFTPEDKAEMIVLGLSGSDGNNLIVHESHENDKLALMLTAVSGIQDMEGNLVGALLVGKQLDDDLLAQINAFRHDIHLFVLHEDQIISQDIAHEESDHEHSTEAANQAISIDNTTLDPETIDAVLNGATTLLPGESDIPAVLALTPFPLNSDYPLMLALQISQEDLIAYEQDIIAIARIFLFSAIVLFTLLVLHFIATNVGQPLGQLNAAAEQMAAGHYDQRIEVKSKDEIGQLGIAFNVMADAIQRRDQDLNALNASLEQRVQERTAELEQANVQLLQEVSEREKAEKMLRQQRQFLRQVLDINPSYIFAKDRNGRFTLVNQAIANAYQTSPQNMIGKTDADFNPDKERVQDFRRDDLAVMDSLEDKFIPEEPTTVAATGALRWLQTLKRPIVDENGRANQVLVVVTDITERKQFEDDLAAARDEAIRASQLKTQLLANVSHDLRTPLNAILGYIELLQLGIYGDISDEQQKVTIQMMESTRQLLEFVNNLLSQAQIESGEMKLHLSPFTPANIINRVQLPLEVLAQSKNVTLTSHIEPDVPEKIMGSESWLNQILLNLVSNAIKFTDQGSVNIDIYLPNASSWAMSVSDTGTGIAEEEQENIFDAFHQVDGSITRGRGGSGLGLSIVHKLTTLMNGKIELTSELNVGSKFTITFPLTLPEENVDDKSLSLNR